MRYLPDVIDKMMLVIPPTQMDLINALRSRKSSASCAPPELQSLWWNETYETLCEYVFGQDVWNGNYWQEALRKIWIGVE